MIPIEEQLKKLKDIMGPVKSGRTMPFGKHKGDDLSDIPINYLRWLLTTNIDLELTADIEDEINRK